MYTHTQIARIASPKEINLNYTEQVDGLLNFDY